MLVDLMQHCRDTNIPMSGPIIQGQARELAEKLKMNYFSVTNGWLEKFKRRHGVQYRQIFGESAKVSDASIKEWRLMFLPSLIAEYVPRDIFNTNQCALFFKLMPNKSFILKGEKYHGEKLSKDRITVLLATNADGSKKLPPLVLGKSTKPRCFKNVK